LAACSWAFQRRAEGLRAASARGPPPGGGREEMRKGIARLLFSRAPCGARCYLLVYTNSVRRERFPVKPRTGHFEFFGGASRSGRAVSPRRPHGGNATLPGGLGEAALPAIVHARTRTPPSMRRLPVRGRIRARRSAPLQCSRFRCCPFSFGRLYGPGAVLNRILPGSSIQRGGASTSSATAPSPGDPRHPALRTCTPHLCARPRIPGANLQLLRGKA